MSKIAWTDKTWNPIVGCSKCSAGCENCYAEKMACRLQRMYDSDPYGKQKHLAKYLDVVGFDFQAEKYNHWNGKTAFDESALSKPLHWRKGRKIFVCSMGDLFHESVPFEWIDQVMMVLNKCPQHIFQILTKRPERMQEYIRRQMIACVATVWPLPNVWLGVTAENQEMADKLIPILLQTPAAKRFVSVEPMLGEMDITEYIPPIFMCEHYKNGIGCTDRLEGEPWDCKICPKNTKPLDWVIVGAESGSNMRWCAPEWPRSLVKQCQSADVPVFVKQLHTTMINTKFKLIKDPAGWPREFPGETIVNS